MAELDQVGGDLGNLADPALRQALEGQTDLAKKGSSSDKSTATLAQPAPLPFSSRLAGVIVVAIAEGLIFALFRAGINLLSQMSGYLQTLHAPTLGDLVFNLGALVVYVAMLGVGLIAAVFLVVIAFVILGQLLPAIQGTKTPAAIAHSLISMVWIFS